MFLQTYFWVFCLKNVSLYECAQVFYYRLIKSLFVIENTPKRVCKNDTFVVIKIGFLVFPLAHVDNLKRKILRH